jgi:hypothetical protein
MVQQTSPHRYAGWSRLPAFLTAVVLLVSLFSLQVQAQDEKATRHAADTPPVSQQEQRLQRIEAELATLHGQVKQLRHGRGILPQVVRIPGWPRVSPYTDVRPERNKAHVRFEGQKYELISIDDLSTASILEASRQQSGDLWEKSFVEDIVEVLEGMGHRPEPTVKLVLRDLDTGKVITVEQAPMTQENRRMVYGHVPIATAKQLIKSVVDSLATGKYRRFKRHTYLSMDQRAFLQFLAQTHDPKVHRAWDVASVGFEAGQASQMAAAFQQIVQQGKLAQFDWNKATIRHFDLDDNDVRAILVVDGKRAELSLNDCSLTPQGLLMFDFPRANFGDSP